MRAIQILLTSALFASSALGQDDCTTAVAISGEGSFAYDRTNNTTSGFHGGGSWCRLSNPVASGVGRDVFFQWTPTVSDFYELNNCGEGLRTNLNVHAGVGCSAVCWMTSISGSCGTPNDSSVQFTGLVGSSYLIQIGDWDITETAPAAASLQIFRPTAIPGNSCSNPITIPASGLASWPFSQMTDSMFSEGTCRGSFLDAFFVWTAPASGAYLLNTCGTGIETYITVYEGTDCAATCSSWSGNNEVCGYDDEIRIVDVQAGDNFLIQVGDNTQSFFPPLTGFLTIAVDASLIPNDTCATPTAISGIGSWADSTTLAAASGFDGNGAAPCADVMLNKDVFFQWTAPSSGDFEVSTEGSTYDTLLSVHQGSGCSATCIGQDEGARDWWYSALEVIGAVAGDSFLIQVGSNRAQWWWNGAGLIGNNAGSVNLSITSLVLPVPSDDCSSPIPISGQGTFSFDTSNATSSGFDGGDPTDCSAEIQRDRFYVWTAPATGDFRIATCNATLLTHVAVHRGTDCNAVCLESDTSSCVGGSLLYVEGVQAGESLLIQIGTTNGAHDDGDLTIDFWPNVPDGDDCKDAIVISAPGSIAWDPALATTSGFDGGDPLRCHSPENPAPQNFASLGNDLFYSFTVPCAGDWRVRAYGVATNGIGMSVHAGNDCSATCMGIGNLVGASPNLAFEYEILGAQAGDTFLVQLDRGSSGTGASTLDVDRIGGLCPPVEVSIVCDPAKPHYQGGYAKLNTSGWDPGPGSELHIEVTDGPSGELGYLLVSASATSAIPLFSGTLCLDGPMARYSPQVATYQAHAPLNSVGVFDGNGRMQNLVGTSASGWGFDVPERLPFTPPGQLITTGDTWYFQVWYRDRIGTPSIPGSSANFSNVARVEFQ